MFMWKKECVKQFIGLLWYHLTAGGINVSSPRWPCHRILYRVFYCSECKRILGSLLVYFTWLLIKQRIYSQGSTSPNKLRGQRKDESNQSRMYSAVLEGGMWDAIIHSLYIHVFNGCDTIICPCGMSKVMNNLILGECADTCTDVNSTYKDVEAGDLIMKLMAMTLITKNLKQML